MAKRKYTDLPFQEQVVADGRYDTSRAPIDRIVLHTTVGTALSAISLFATTPAPGKETSAHYLVKKDGGLIAFLEEYNTAYHCGNYAFNQRSIGIEHEDGGDYNGIRPDSLYSSSAKLVANICKFYFIPCDSAHIFRHHDVLGASTACPDALDTDRIIREANAILNPVVTPPAPQLPSELQHYIENWKDIAIQKGLDVNNAMFNDYRAIDAIIAKKNAESDKIINTNKTIIENLNQQINDRNNDIVQLNAQVSTLKSQLLESQTRESSLEEQAKALPSLKEQVLELERQKKVWADKEDVYKKNIKKLTDENAKLKKNWLAGLFGNFFNK